MPGPLDAIRTYTNADINKAQGRKPAKPQGGMVADDVTMNPNRRIVPTKYEQGPGADQLLAEARGSVDRVQDRYGDMSGVANLIEAATALRQESEAAKPWWDGPMDAMAGLRSAGETAHTIGSRLSVAALPVTPFAPPLAAGMYAAGNALMAPDTIRRIINPDEDESRGRAAAELAYLGAGPMVRALRAGTTAYKDARAAKTFQSGANDAIDQFLKPSNVTKRGYAAQKDAGFGGRMASKLGGQSSEVKGYAGVQKPANRPVNVQRPAAPAEPVIQPDIHDGADAFQRVVAAAREQVKGQRLQGPPPAPETLMKAPMTPYATNNVPSSVPMPKMQAGPTQAQPRRPDAMLPEIMRRYVRDPYTHDKAMDRILREAAETGDFPGAEFVPNPQPLGNTMSGLPDSMWNRLIQQFGGRGK